ncbi:PREDICTED: ESF1 homolog [Cyphomyrmex costatus]|uniref:ESF1 like protein n=1 Tax=Cyphomyrmex costatus TaxID=456900 RepID=A0A195CI36_9HYME|nr:PREDICTED: ESF1 homolog [Cyphomyrmex costatus]KYN00396.1 ESF1 like protein [Cyphomyrmex costatus]
MDEMLKDSRIMDKKPKDPRFAHIAKDPKFRRIPKAKRTVKIDDRFKGMFKDKKFIMKYTVDKRGRPVNQTITEDLRKYYDLSSSEDEDTSVSSTNKKDNKKKVKDIKGKKKDKKKEIELKTEIDSSDKRNEDEKNKDVCLLNQKNFSELKTKEESSNEDESSDNETKSVQKEFSQAELDKNNKKLHKRRKNENSILTHEIKEKLRDLTVNYARGEGVLLSDSSSEEESYEASDAEEEIEHNWGELDKDAETTNEITCRLAICNMDWDRIRAVDLMILLNSFLPSTGLIYSVTIYPSEFGLQRMKEEEINGPAELKDEAVRSKDEIEDDNEEGSKYHMEKLRQYQLNRLKYYYAVAEFDSTETANKVYTECDGIEYESTATRLDLRFIPDNMTFDQESKEVCTEIPEPIKYQPRQFTTTALQQAKVQLTWDETNPDRQEFTQKLNSGKLQNIDENDLQTYLASGSEDDLDTEEKIDLAEKINNNSEKESEENNDLIGKYKSLLKTIEEEEEAKKNKDVELEFSWGLDIKEKTEKFVKENMKNKEELTPFEQYLEKRKAKKKAKREERKKLKEESQKSDSEDSVPSDVDMNNKYFANELKNSKLSHEKGKEDNEADIDSSNEQESSRCKAELELLLMDQDEDDKKHFNMKQIEENATMSKSKQKRLNKKKTVREEEAKEDNFKVNVKDSRFTALFTSHHFNIDPADPHYRKTKGTEALINEKLKRRAENEAHTENDKQFKKPKTDEKLPMELQALVKSVKRNTQTITQPIKK